MAKQSQKQPKPTSFKGISEMPYCTMSSALMTWNATGSWRYLRPRYIDQIPACQAACPTANNIEAWIRLLEQGKIEEAFEKATLENPFPAIMGRVCFHPCQESCNRNEMGGPVSIQMLERVLADAAGSDPAVPKPFRAQSKKKIAVIGSGPAGLACAYHLTRLGHKAVVIERNSRGGGVLRYGIPEYRLPREIIDIEIERLKKMGIDFHLGKIVRDAAEMQMLRQEYDAVFLAIGAHKSRPLGIPDEKAEGVMPGLTFLDLASQGKAPPLGKKVLVIGGGNTAIDAARTARRFGSEVTILYRRSREEMPAFEAEVKEALAEDIKIEFLTIPKQILVKDGRAGGLICERAKLGEPDESGRRSPVPISGSEHTFEATAILSAVGEEIETAIIPSALAIHKGALATKSGGRTEWHNVFAGGDFIEQPRTAVDALAAGKKAAIAIDCFFRKEDFDTVFQKIRIGDSNTVRMADYLRYLAGDKKEQESPDVIAKNRIAKFEDLNTAYFRHSNPNEYPMRQVKERFLHRPFAEVHQQPSKEVVADELSRCFHCGRCTQCDNCFIYCPDISIVKAEGGYNVDLTYCKGCGVCVFECPRAAMELIEEPTEI
jgi:NADPH-dependent glutamate synthase beta subunit-like oxidoreductase/Pyruvate/2-oxoacid:ferredoxin oxidoreductase delta subunit